MKKKYFLYSYSPANGLYFICNNNDVCTTTNITKQSVTDNIEYVDTYNGINKNVLLNATSTTLLLATFTSYYDFITNYPELLL